MPARTPTPFAAFITLWMTNTDAATNVSGSDQQDYSGVFHITSGANDTGTNYLSGTFSGLLSGSNGGTSLAFSSSGHVWSTSDQIRSPNLQDPTAVAFSFTNVTPVVNITCRPIGSFTSSISGNMSSNSWRRPRPRRRLRRRACPSRPRSP